LEASVSVLAALAIADASELAAGPLSESLVIPRRCRPVLTTLTVDMKSIAGGCSA
jgi:hypothetical protein